VRWAWFAAAVLVAAVAGGSVAWFTRDQTAGQPSAAASASQAQPSAPPLTVGQAASLMARLTSGDSAEVTSAIAMPSGQQVPASAVRGLRTLAPVTADVGSFRELAPAVGSLTATDRTGTKWLVHLVWQNGAWLVLDSVKR
jgi:hypothetical protein